MLLNTTSAGDVPLARRHPSGGSLAFCRGDVEAEHHPALVMLGDVAVGHPATRVRHVEQDLDRLAGAAEFAAAEVKPLAPVPVSSTTAIAAATSLQDLTTRL
jgi:hypothetical protein